MSAIPPNIARQADRVKAALETAANIEKGSAGPCSTCKHMAVRWVFAQGYKPCCTNPLVAVPAFDVVSHEVQHPVVTCVKAREGLCGAEGLFYARSFAGLSPAWRVAGVVGIVANILLVAYWVL